MSAEASDRFIRPIRLNRILVVPTAETTVEGRRAWTCSICWPDHERSVVMLYLGGDTYRFIYDPGSELNHRVFATVTIEG